MLLAFAWPQHIHHGRVKQWIRQQRSRGKISIATCPITELGFLRISMNIRGYAADFESARTLLVNLITHKGFKHSFWMDDLPPLSGKWDSNLGPSQLTDVYLANLAANHVGSKLTTFDRGIEGPSVEVISP